LLSLDIRDQPPNRKYLINDLENMDDLASGNVPILFINIPYFYYETGVLTRKNAIRYYRSKDSHIREREKIPFGTETGKNKHTNPKL